MTVPGLVLNVVADHAAMSRRAADIVAETVARWPEGAIAVPTGSTPLGMFAELIGRVRGGAVDLSRVHVWCLDEYVGVGEGDPNSLTGWLRRSFLDPAGVPMGNVRPVPATDPDPDSAAAGFEAGLANEGGLDLAVLGLGPNGHVAYNEPGAAANSRTRVVALPPGSIAQAAASWHPTVPLPERAMTVGVGTLLDARRLVLMVSGDTKATILRRMLREPMSAEVPASWLRLAGSRLEVVADESAAWLLTLPSAGFDQHPQSAGHAERRTA